jgi:hypothetical protein
MQPRPLRLVDDRDVIFASSADAIGAQVDAVRIPDRNGLDLAWPGRWWLRRSSSTIRPVNGFAGAVPGGAN